jgi:hypothetical protein
VEAWSSDGCIRHTVDVNGRSHLTRYGLVYRVGGAFVVGLVLGGWWVIGGAAHHKPVYVVLGIMLLGLSVPMLIGTTRVWRIARDVAAASQGATPEGVGPPSSASRVPPWRLILALVSVAVLVVGGIVRRDHPVTGLVIVLAAFAIALPLSPGIARAVRRR